MASDEAQVTGLTELNARLEQLAPKIEKRLLRGALRAGVRVILLRAKQLIHSVSGELAKSLRISTSARSGTIKARLLAGNAKAFYAHMVEFGTLGHIISATEGALSFLGIDVARVEHPGAHAKPFMRPAYDSAATNESEALRAVADYLSQRLDQLDQLPEETK